VQWNRRDANKCVAASAGITSSSADGRANGAQAETEEGKEEHDNKAGEDGPSEGRVSRACKLAISASKAAKLFASAMNAWCAADVAQCCSTDPEKLAAQHSQNPPAGTTALTLARGAPTGAFWPGATATAGARRDATRSCGGSSSGIGGGGDMAGGGAGASVTSMPSSEASSTALPSLAPGADRESGAAPAANALTSAPAAAAAATLGTKARPPLPLGAARAALPVGGWRGCGGGSSFGGGGHWSLGVKKDRPGGASGCKRHASSLAALKALFRSS
jgi:hypothetical protein